MLKAQVMRRQPELYSYVVEHDTGHAPNPYFRVCTLCRCKYRKSDKKPRNVVELAEEGDWIVGTGGADKRKTAGHGKLVYAMRVDEILTRAEYYADRRFSQKKRRRAGNYADTRGDNLVPASRFEEHQRVLVSRHFYYFGANAIRIPKRFSYLEKRGPGFKRKFTPEQISSFVEWLEGKHRPGKQGEPCMSRADGRMRCGSSC